MIKELTASVVYNYPKWNELRLKKLPTRNARRVQFTKAVMMQDRIISHPHALVYGVLYSHIAYRRKRVSKTRNKKIAKLAEKMRRSSVKCVHMNGDYYYLQY